MINSVTQLPLAMRFYLIGLTYRNSRMSCVCLTSLVEVSRLLYLSFPYSIRLWEWFAAAIITKGYLLIDDMSWHRFGKKLEGVSFVWDSAIGKKILGTNVVLLIRTDGEKRVPIGLRIWQKGGKSKVKLAMELLWEVRRRGVTPIYVLFDAWYSAESLLNLVDEFGWHYSTRVKKNRLFNGVRINQTFRHHYGRKQGKLKRINHEVLIVKDGTRFLLTNNLSLTSAQLKTLYRVRQQIEEVFRRLNRSSVGADVGQIRYKRKRRICISDCMLFVWCNVKPKKKNQRSMRINKIYFENKYHRKVSFYRAFLTLRNIS